MPNDELKRLMRAEKISQWQIADELGVHENTVLRKLRKELTDSERAQFMQAVESIRAKRKTA